MKYLYIIGTVLCTVYGQLILKWRINRYGNLPENWDSAIIYLFSLFKDLYILSGLAAAFVASLFWMAAMTKFDVSYAYPFVSSAFVLVFIFSILLLQEPFTWNKAFGVILIMLGIAISSRSA